MTASFPRLPALALAAASMLALTACSSLPKDVDRGPVRTPSNFRGPDAWPVEISRVAVLPAHDATGRLPAEFAATYDFSWARALALTQRAEFVGVTRATLSDWSGRETVDSAAPLPPGLFQRVLAETGAQAVLFLDLTQVKPYPPLSLGFRARLATAPAGDTRWMADEIFDAGDGATARMLRMEARAHNSTAGDPTTAVMQSPIRLADHAFRSVAGLLPPRRAAAPSPKESRAATTSGGNAGTEDSKDDKLGAKKFPVRADNPN
ncbi:MAG: hypothetical protein RLZZ50_823 [Verrucomicrobiota bacterium]